MVKIFYSDIKDFTYQESLIDNFCLARKKYINSIKDTKRKCQSVVAWLLLKNIFALLDIKDDVYVNEHGKWCFFDNNIKFSISHSNNIVAIAVGDCEFLGIDVEKCDEKIIKLEKKLDVNIRSNLSLIESLTIEWTKRESAFKAGKECNFVSKKIFDKNNDEYILTVCSNATVDKPKFIDIKELI